MANARLQQYVLPLPRAFDVDPKTTNPENLIDTKVGIEK